MFYLGLFLIVIGTGLLKGNVSVIVGKLYAQGDNRRDAGFSIFYMGINLGAFIAPLICGYLGQQINWHFGFAAAGVGMTLGVIQYVLGSRNLGDAGLLPAPGTPEQVAKWRRQGQIAARHPGRAGVDRRRRRLHRAWCRSPRRQVADAAGVFLLLVIVGFFGWMYSSSEWTPEERKRLYVIGVLFLAASLFWSVFEQAGSTLEPVRRSQHLQQRVRLRFPEQLVPVDELAVPDHLRAGDGVGLDQAGARRARTRRRRRSSPGAWCSSVSASRS